MRTVDVGETVTLRAQFTDQDDALADPTSQTLDITAPDGTVTNLTQASLTNDSTGIWRYNLAITAAGLWTWTWTGTGGGVDTVASDSLVAGRLPYGPCQVWAGPQDVDRLHDDASTLDQGLLAEMLLVASDVLFPLSRHRFAGHCRDTVRPCSRPCVRGGPSDPGAGATTAPPSRSLWVRCRHGRSRCSCGYVDEVTLGGAPIVAIHEVKVDGAVVSPARYRVDDHRWLVRLEDADGTRPGWPTCVDMLEDPDADDDTFQVDFTYGRKPPDAGRVAAAELAYQLALASTGADGCQLPQRVQTITRQGISFAVLDPFDFLEAGRTGIYLVDAFLQAFNPSGARRDPAILSPDGTGAVRRAGTA